MSRQGCLGNYGSVRKYRGFYAFFMLEFRDFSNACMLKLFFRKNFSLFLVFLFILALSSVLETRFLKFSRIEQVPVFNVVQANGDSVSLNADGELIPIPPGPIDLKSGQTLITHDDSDILIELNGASYLRLGANSKLRVDSMSLNGNILKNIVLYLESGRLWINNSFNPVDYNIFTNKTLIVPGNAIFEMNYDGSRLYVYNHAHDLNIGLLSQPYSELKRTGDTGNLFYNYFFLPEGNRIDIAESKISPKLATLLLSKLVKEFPVQLVLKEDLLKDAFYQQNLEYDNLYADRYALLYVESLKETVVLSKFANLQQLYLEHFERNKFPLIFSKNKSDLSKSAFLAKTFDIAQVWSLNEDSRLAERNSNQFYSFWNSSLGFLNFDSRPYLGKELQALRGILHTSVLYAGKKRVWDASFDTLRRARDFKGLVTLLLENLEEVYDLMDMAEYGEALTGFNEWTARLNLFLSSYNKEDLLVYYPDVEILRQNVNNLFARYSDFYTEDHFSALTYMDQKLIELSPDKLEQEENRQTIVQDRIKILKKLSYLIQNNKIDRKKGVTLGHSMLANLIALRNQALYRVAIYDYFDSEIDKQKLLFEFYDSPEYLLLKGGFEEAFRTFIASRADWDSLQEYLQQVPPGRSKVKRVDTDKLIASVYAQFTERKIYPDQIGALSDDQNRLYEIQQGSVGQNIFSGMFDNQTKLIYDLTVNGQRLSKGVHIDKLREVVNSIALVGEEATSDRTSAEVVVSEELQENVSYSSAESLAVTLAVNELRENGFFISKDDVEILDLLENRFYVTAVELDEFAHVVSFEFDNTHDKLKKVMVNAKVQSTVHSADTEVKKLYLDGEFGTDGLADRLTVAVDGLLNNTRAVTEQVKVKVKR